MLCNCLYFGATVYLGSTSPASDFNELNRLVCFLIKNSNPPPLTPLDFVARGQPIKKACVPQKTKGLIVETAEYFCCLLTLHSLDSDFENRLLLSQQSFHHRAKLSWRKKRKHNQTLEFPCDSVKRLLTLQSTGLRCCSIANCYTVPRVKTYSCQTAIT